MTDTYDDTPEAEVQYRATRVSTRAELERMRHTSEFKQMRAQFRKESRLLKSVCWLCGEEIDYALTSPDPQSFTLDHAIPVSEHPELLMDRNNFRASHRKCNEDRGTKEPALDTGIPSEVW